MKIYINGILQEDAFLEIKGDKCNITLRELDEVSELIKSVAKLKNVTVKAILGKSRDKALVTCRAIISLYLLNENYSYPEIATRLKKDRSSIYNYQRQNYLWQNDLNKFLELKKGS